MCDKLTRFMYDLIFENILVIFHFSEAKTHHAHYMATLDPPYFSFLFLVVIVRVLTSRHMSSGVID
jgi:hypothetical protein